MKLIETTNEITVTGLSRKEYKFYGYRISKNDEDNQDEIPIECVYIFSKKSIHIMDAGN